jgi:hypothetical protein
MSEFAAYCRKKAAQCRRLARMINDPVAIEELTKMATEFEARAAALESEKGAIGKIIRLAKRPKKH